MTIPSDYRERIYAGVLGKLIGVYLGRPFEGWTYERIMNELGPVFYYVNERLNVPLVVTDDDVSGTFTFIRALEDYGITPDLASEDIGRAWLNYIIENRTVLWWGGNGNSTEHSAWLNLKKGIAAPLSGSAETNGTAVAEQIGAQIFIDGWAMVAPGEPAMAAKLAGEAGRVSHDGESVHAAMLWAAMEAEAFRSDDIDHLIDTGLSFIPPDCEIARLIADVRRWHKLYADWQDTRAEIETHYGYHRYPGNCHVIPNHALMIMAVLYAPDDFHKAQLIVNTSGRDTDCNAGNVGCLQGIMLGLSGLEAGPDWRGPLADRMLISSADGGNAINDAAHMALYIEKLGRRLAGEPDAERPKNGARFHFSLPGSVQGFRSLSDDGACASVDVLNERFEDTYCLAMAYDALAPGQHASMTTPVFASPDVLKMHTYELMATPLVYPGQMLKARVIAPETNEGPVSVFLIARVYGPDDRLETLSGPAVRLAPGEEAFLNWQVPQTDGQPVAEIGISAVAAGRRAGGRVLLDYLGIEGAADMVLRRPQGGGDFWRKAWVNGVSFFSRNFPASFRIAQSTGEGLIAHGTRQWTDYLVHSNLLVHMGNHAGIAVRVQGMKRFYAVRVTRRNQLEIIKMLDDDEIILAQRPFDFAFERAVPIEVMVRGDVISANVAGVDIEAQDPGPGILFDGGFGLLVHEGALSVDEIRVSPV